MRGKVSAQWRKIVSLIDSFLMGRRAAIDENPRIRFFCYAVLISMMLLWGFFFIDLGSISSFRSMLTALAAVGQVASLVVLRYAADAKNAFRISTLVLLAYFLFLIGIGGPHGTLLFWMLVFPVYAFLLFGGREGLLWTAAGFLGSVYVLLDPHAILSTFPYELAVKGRFLITYALLGAVTRAFERVTYRPQEDIARRRAAQLEEAVQRLSEEIKERTQIQAELIFSEQRFRTLSDASFEGIAVTEGGTFVDLNDQLARMFGYDRSEMIGMRGISCVTQEHGVVNNAILSGKAGPCEHLAQRQDGSVFPVEVQSRVREVGGRLLTVSAIRDISDRKKAETETREAKEFAEAILASLPGTFFVFDEQLRLTRWNNDFRKVAGYTGEELLGKHPLDMIDEPEKDSVRKRIEQILLHETGSLEATALTKAGDRIPYLFNAVWRSIGERRYLIGTGIDISDRRQADQQRRRSEELFRLAFQTIPDSVAITKLENGVFVDVNPSFSEVLGYPKDDVIGRSSLNLPLWVDPHAREEMVQDLARKGFVRNLEAQFCTKEGTLITGLFSGSSFNVDGEPHILSMIKDVTDIKRAEEERAGLERQVLHTQRLESLGVLAGGIAHDFNNILTGILGNADLGLMRMSPMATARNNIEEIKKGALRGAGLANQMLAYSGKGKFELRPFDLSELVREMAQLLDVSISKKALLTYSLADNLPLVEGDVNQIQQIVMNLITNASESLGQKNGIIRLSTASMFCDRRYLDSVTEELESIYEEPLPEGVYTSLEVTDTGCGMDSETQRKVFDPFFTTKFSGRGLGMAAVRGIVRGHGGAVKVYSEVGKGSTFKVLLPAKPDLRTTPMQQAADENVHPFRQGGVVLVVDDEPTVCEIARDMLGEIGLIVLTASDGHQAVEVFRENIERISCVLLDLTMPGLDGIETFLEMRRLRPDVKVILSSGYNEQDVTQRLVDKGLAGFIQKPYTLEKLRDKLNEVFRIG